MKKKYGYKSLLCGNIFKEVDSNYKSYMTNLKFSFKNKVFKFKISFFIAKKKLDNFYLNQQI